MKIQGPFTAKLYGNWVAKVDTLVFARRIAAALNRDEARKATNKLGATLPKRRQAKKACLSGSHTPLD